MKTKLLLILAAIATNVCYAVEYVDLGLSSGTLWANCNVGATNPWDAGDYFAWGETATKTNYSWSTYVLAKGESNKLTKYCGYTNLGYNGYTDHKINLDPADDAARANMGSGWCMPTSAQWQMLWEECYWEWTNSYAGHGVKGYIVYRSVDKTKDKKHTKGTSYVYSISNDVHIFLPQVGSYSNTSLVNDNELDYWSASVFESNPKSSYVFSAKENQDAAVAVMSRCTGNPVRAISTTRYDLWICGVQINEINCTDLAADIDGVSGTVSFDPSITTLTMQDATINAEKAYAIQNSIPDLKIKVLGTNTINGDKDWSGIRLNKNTEITGGGNLSVKTTGEGIGIFIYNTNEVSFTENITLSVTGGTELYAEGMSGISGYGGSASMNRTYGAVLSVTDSRVTAAFHGNTSVLNSGRKGGGIEYLHALNLDGVEIISPRNVTFVPKTMSNIVSSTDNTLIFNEVNIDKAFVDLGLSSGTLWATFNVGANAPEDYGDHFAWGETAPKTDYNFYNYALSDNQDGNLTKYCFESNKGYNGFTDELTVLVPNDDAATANVGAEWCIPTQNQWKELLNECYWVLTSDYQGKGIEGNIVYRSADKSKDNKRTKNSDHEYSISTDAHIFIPSAGRYIDGTELETSNVGGYWSASLHKNNSFSAYSTLISTVNIFADDNGSRYKGKTVRAVKAQNYKVTLTQPAVGGTIRLLEETINLNEDVRERTELHFVAEANENYEFDSWSGCSENGYLIVTGDATVTCTFKPKSATAVKNIGTAAPKVSKVLENGTMYIIKGGVKYNLQGVKCEGE